MRPQPGFARSFGLLLGPPNLVLGDCWAPPGAPALFCGVFGAAGATTLFWGIVGLLLGPQHCFAGGFGGMVGLLLGPNLVLRGVLGPTWGPNLVLGDCWPRLGAPTLFCGEFWAPPGDL